MNWIRDPETGSYLHKDEQFKIERDPYGSGWTFQGYERNGLKWDRIPLCFSRRLRDVQENIEKKIKERG